MGHSPTLSVIVSCYGADAFIDGYVECLRAARSQCEFDLVVADFPFSHRSPGHVREQLASLGQVRFMTFDRNLSLYAAWNRAIAAADTDLVTNLNLDDRVEPGYYRAAVDAIAEHRLDVFSSRAIATPCVGDRMASGATLQPHLPDLAFADSDICTYGIEELVSVKAGTVRKNSIPHCAPVWRRRLHECLGWFDSESFDFAADFEFWLRCAVAGARFGLSRHPLTCFYQSTSTASGRLIHPENQAVVDAWRREFPPAGYVESHLGKGHDLLHFALNHHAVTSDARYFAHLATEVRQYLRERSEEFWRGRPPRFARARPLSLSPAAGRLPAAVEPDKIRKWKNRFAGREALLVCNGPSLNKVDFQKIRPDLLAVGLNKIFLGVERFGLDLDLLVSVNNKVLDQAADVFSRLSIPLFVSSRDSGAALADHEHVVVVNTTAHPPSAPRFSIDPARFVHEGWTVTHVALQLLAYMGVESVYIIGMDHSFRQAVGGVANAHASISGADVDHFDPAYFGFGQSWDLPDLENSELSYHAAKESYRACGRRIFDCTIGGKCRVFPKLDVSMIYRDAPFERDQVSGDERLEVAVSVIMPLRNGARFLERAVRSVLNGLPEDGELIIVDDSSTDNSLDLAGQFAAESPAVRVVRNFHRPGVSGARNSGLDLARGRYVAFLDADDEVGIGSLACRRALLDREPEIAIVHGVARLVSSSGVDLGLRVGIRRNITVADCISNPAHLNTIMIRRKALGEIRFDESLSNGEDWKYLTELLGNSSGSRFVDGAGASYRIHPTSTVQMNIARHLEGVQAAVKWLYQFGPFLGSISSAQDSGQSAEADIIQSRALGTWLIGCMMADTSGGELPRAPSELSERLSTLRVDALRSSLRTAYVRAFCKPIWEDRGSLFRNLVERLAGKLGEPEAGSMGASFGSLLRQAIRVEPPPPDVLLGPFSRDVNAHVDETHAVFALCERIGLRGIMFDVGAHHGTSLLPFAHSGWRIFAFEPDRSNRPKLMEVIQKEGLSDLVCVDERAVSDRSGMSIPFYSSNVSSGISGLSRFHSSHRSEYLVETTTLSDFVDQHSIDDVAFLKIDVEGFDLHVLRGFPWHNLRPKIVECEFEDRKTLPLGYSFHDIAGKLLDLGYRVYVSEWHPIQRYGIRHDWARLKEYPCELASDDAWGNLVAISPAIAESDLISAFEQKLNSLAESAGIKCATQPALLALPQEIAISCQGGEMRNSGSGGVEFRPGSPESVSLFFEAPWLDVRPGCRLQALIRLRALQPGKFRVALCRHGDTEYEGSARVIDLDSDSDSLVSIDHQFKGRHSGVRVQIDLLPLHRALPAGCRVEGVFFEGATSNRCGIQGTERRISLANALFKSGQYFDAMSEYLQVQEPLRRLVQGNFVLAASRCGMSNALASMRFEQITSPDGRQSSS